MEGESGKVILTEVQIPSFIKTLREAVNQQMVTGATIGEVVAFSQGISIVFLSLEAALARAAKGTSADEGLSGDGEQQRHG